MNHFVNDKNHGLRTPNEGINQTLGRCGRQTMLRLNPKFKFKSPKNIWDYFLGFESKLQWILVIVNLVIP